MLSASLRVAAPLRSRPQTTLLRSFVSSSAFVLSRSSPVSPSLSPSASRSPSPSCSSLPRSLGLSASPLRRRPSLSLPSSSSIASSLSSSTRPFASAASASYSTQPPANSSTPPKDKARGHSNLNRPSASAMASQPDPEALLGRVRELGRALHGLDEIPPNLFVQYIDPHTTAVDDDGKKKKLSPAVLTLEQTMRLPELKPWFDQGKTVPRLLKIGNNDPTHASPFGIVEFLSMEEIVTEEKERARLERAKKKATVHGPSAIGHRSGLRNNAAPKELEMIWQMAPGDVKHRTAQIEGFLRDSWRVKVVFRPKRKGAKKARIVDAQEKQQIVDDFVASIEEIAQRYQEDRMDEGNQWHAVFLEPTKWLKNENVKAEKLKQQQKEEALQAAFRRKEENKQRAAEAAKKHEESIWKPPPEWL